MIDIESFALIDGTEIELSRCRCQSYYIGKGFCFASGARLLCGRQVAGGCEKKAVKVQHDKCVPILDLPQVDPRFRTQKSMLAN